MIIYSKVDLSFQEKQNLVVLTHVSFFLCHFSLLGGRHGILFFEILLTVVCKTMLKVVAVITEISWSLMTSEVVTGRSLVNLEEVASR